MINIPTLQQLYNSILADLENEYGITIPLFGKNSLRAQAAVQAGKLWIYYKLIGFLQKNIFADTADPEAIGGTLERFGRVKLGRNPFPAVAGQYSVLVTGTPGQTIPALTTFKSNDDSANPGLLYILDAPFTLTAGPDFITLRALTAGLDAELEIGNQLTVTTPLALIDPIVSVAVEVVQPLAAETIDEYRRKVLDAYRLEPQGGAGADYRIWAADVQGVFQSYPYAKIGFANEINLFVEATIADSTDGKGTPTAGILQDVEDSIELPTASRPSRKPLAVYNIDYLPVTPKDIDITITGFVGLTAAIQTDIFNTIKAELDSVRPFVSSIDIVANKNDIFDTNKIISLIIEANPGSVFGAVQLEIDAVVFPTYTFTDGNIPFLNSVNYV
jgi:uncharacterized phage protein gp47/JayE